MSLPMPQMPPCVPKWLPGPKKGPASLQSSEATLQAQPQFALPQFALPQALPQALSQSQSQVLLPQMLPQVNVQQQEQYQQRSIGSSAVAYSAALGPRPMAEGNATGAYSGVQMSYLPPVTTSVATPASAYRTEASTLPGPQFQYAQATPAVTARPMVMEQVVNASQPIVYSASASQQPFTTTAPCVSYQPVPTYGASSSQQLVTTTAPSVSYQPVPTYAGSTSQQFGTTTAPSVSYQPVPTYSASGPVVSYIPAPVVQTTVQTLAPNSYVPAAPIAQRGPSRGLAASQQAVHTPAPKFINGIEYVEPAPAVYVGPALAVSSSGSLYDATALTSQTAPVVGSAAPAGFEFVTPSAAGPLLQNRPQGIGGMGAIEYVEPAPAVYVGPALTVPAGASAADYAVSAPAAYAAPQASATNSEMSSSMRQFEDMLVRSTAVSSIENMLAQQTSAFQNSTMPAPTVASQLGPAVEYVEPAPAVEYAVAAPYTDWDAVARSWDAVAAQRAIVEPGTVAAGAVGAAPLVADYAAPLNGAEYATPSQDAASPGVEIDYVSIAGMQIPMFMDYHLQSWQPIQLREHAEGLHQTLGPEQLGILLPEHDHELVPWILHVQRVHMEPLKANPVLAIQG